MTAIQEACARIGAVTGKGLAARTLTIFSLTVVGLLLTAILAGGKVAMWCVISVGLFTSIGWSNTFSLAIEGLGRKSACILGRMLCSSSRRCPAHQGYAAAVKAQERFLKKTSIGQLADRFSRIGKSGRVL